MAGMNRVTLIGYLGADPKVQQVKENRSMCLFSLATSERYKDKKGDMVERTTWHNITIFGKLADICGSSLKKGSHIFLEGRLENRTWEDEEKKKQYATQIVATDVVFLDRKSTASGSSPSTSMVVESPDGDLPMNI